MAIELPACGGRAVTKRDAAARLRLMATVMRNAMFDDEGIAAWADELDEIADGLDPISTLHNPQSE